MKAVRMEVVKGWLRGQGSFWHKSYLIDYMCVAVALLMMLSIQLFITPFEQVVDWQAFEYQYPHQEHDTVPSWVMMLVSFSVPLAVFLAMCVKHRSLHEFHHAILFFILSVLLVSIACLTCKNLGYLRPDFMHRCKPVFKNGQFVRCLGDKRVVLKGRRSFFSGHTALPMVSYIALDLYLIFMHFNPYRQSHGNLPLVFLLLLGPFVATLIGFSRIIDYRHHPIDVAVGGLVGMVVPCFTFPLYFDAWQGTVKSRGGYRMTDYFGLTPLPL